MRPFVAALARAALLSSWLNFATEVWPLLIDKDGFGGVWLGADYVPFERCIWTAGTRQPKAGEEAGTSFGAAGKAALPLVPPKRKKNSPVRLEEEEEPHEVLARKMANQKQTKLVFGKPKVTGQEEAALLPMRVGNGKAVLDVNGDASFSHTQYTSDAQGRTVSIHGPVQEEAAATTTSSSTGGGDVWLLLQRLGCQGEPIVALDEALGAFLRADLTPEAASLASTEHTMLLASVRTCCLRG